MIDRYKLAIELARKDITYTELSIIANVSSKTIARINKQRYTKVRIDVISRICIALEIEPETIMADKVVEN